MNSIPEPQTQITADSVSTLFERRGRKIRNVAALGAIVKLIPVVGESLHHALTAGDSAIRDAHIDMQLELICTLIQNIDSAISQMHDDAAKQGVPFTEISGNISVKSLNVDTSIGLDASSGKTVILRPGTTISVDATNGTTAIGVKT